MALSLFVKLAILLGLGAWLIGRRPSSEALTPVADGARGSERAIAVRRSAMAERFGWACLIVGILAEVAYGIFGTMDPPALSHAVQMLLQFGGYGFLGGAFILMGVSGWLKA